MSYEQARGFRLACVIDSMGNVGAAWLTDEQEAIIRRVCEAAGIRFVTNVVGQPTAVMMGMAT